MNKLIAMTASTIMLMAAGTSLANNVQLSSDGSNHPTIASAIASAASTDTLTISPGIYNENLLVDHKDLKFIGNGPGNTSVIIGTTPPATSTTNIFRCGTLGGPGVEHLTFENLTIQGGSNAEYGVGAGVYLTDGAVGTFTNCMIRWNEASLKGGGIYVDVNSTCTLSNCDLGGNKAPIGSAICHQTCIDLTIHGGVITQDNTVYPVCHKAIGLPGDINADGTINKHDIYRLKSGLGVCKTDVNTSGQVNIDDLLLVIEDWNDGCGYDGFDPTGACCPTTDPIAYCTEITEEQCELMGEGFQWKGAGTTCELDCEGMCCNDNTSECYDYVTPAYCTSLGGTFTPASIHNLCPYLCAGNCCMLVGDTYECHGNYTKIDCEAQQGVWTRYDEPCGPNCTD